MANTKTILVTGAGSGIGRAIAQRLSKNNYPLILLGRNQDKLEEARNSLESPEKHQYTGQILWMIGWGNRYGKPTGKR